MTQIDIDKIRGEWQFNDNNGTMAGGNDTIQSIKMVAEKVNEIINEIKFKKSHLIQNGIPIFENKDKIPMK